MKVNFDGAMFNERDEAGIGVIIRNPRGEVMAALSEKIQKPPSTEILELLATKRAVRFSLETGFNKSVFEGDSELVIKSLRHGGYENSLGGHLINDILFTVNSFQSISFSHVVWQSNAVAHALAQRARHSFPLLVWMEAVAPDVSTFVLSDFPR